MGPFVAAAIASVIEFKRKEKADLMTEIDVISAKNSPDVYLSCFACMISFGSSEI